jgi:hypothetical protein
MKFEEKVDEESTLYDFKDKINYTPKKKMLCYGVMKTPDMKFILPEPGSKEPVCHKELRRKGRYDNT